MTASDRSASLVPCLVGHRRRDARDDPHHFVLCHFHLPPIASLMRLPPSAYIRLVRPRTDPASSSSPSHRTAEASTLTPPTRSGETRCIRLVWRLTTGERVGRLVTPGGGTARGKIPGLGSYHTRRPHAAPPFGLPRCIRDPVRIGRSDGGPRSHLERLAREMAIVDRADRPAHDEPRVEIQDRPQVGLAILADPQFARIPHPSLIRSFGGDVLLQQIRGDRLLVIAIAPG